MINLRKNSKYSILYRDIRDKKEYHYFRMCADCSAVQIELKNIKSQIHAILRVEKIWKMSRIIVIIEK